MRLLNGRLLTTIGVVVALAGLLVFSLSAPSTTLGQETDVGTGAEPPASVPDGDAGDAGTSPQQLPASGAGTPESGSTNILLVSMLLAAGVTITGAGIEASRMRRDSQET